MKYIIRPILLILTIFCFSGCGNTKESIKTFDIETQYTTLEYPDKWKDMLRTEEQDNHVTFWGTVGEKEIELFSIEFGSSDGYLLGTLSGTEIYIVETDLSFDDSWNDEEKETIYTMQEDINTILQGLMELDGFELAK